MAQLGDKFVSCPDQFKRYDQNSSFVYFSDQTWNVRSWGRFIVSINGYIEFYVKDATEIRCINLTEASCGVQHVQINNEDISDLYYSNFKKSGYVIDSVSNAYNTLCFIHYPKSQYTKVRIYNTENVQLNFSYIDINENATLITKEEYETYTSIKFILKDNGIYKSYNVETNTLDIIEDITSLDKQILTGVDIKYIPNALELLPDLTNVKLIHTADIRIYGIKNNLEMISMRTDIYTNQIDKINSIMTNLSLSGGSSIKFSVSTDSGITWKTYKDDSWETLDIIIPQNKYSKLSDEDKEKWNNAMNTINTDGINSEILNTLDFNLINSGKMRFAIVLNNKNYDDQCAIQNIIYNATMKDYLQQCSESEVECTVIGNIIKAKSNISNKRLVFNINTAGTTGSSIQSDPIIINNKVLQGVMDLDDLGIASKDSVTELNDRLNAISGDRQNYKGYYATEIDRDTVLTEPEEGDYCIVDASTLEDPKYHNKTIKYYYTKMNWEIYCIIPEGTVQIDDNSKTDIDKTWSIKKIYEELEKKQDKNGEYNITIDSSLFELIEDGEYKGFYKIPIMHGLKCTNKFNMSVVTLDGKSCSMCVFFDNVQENSFDLYAISDTSIILSIYAY